MLVLLLLTDTIKLNTYADFLLPVLIELFSKQNFNIIETNGFSETRQTSVSAGNAVIMVHLNGKSPSFINTIRLRSLIKKQQILYVVQVTGKKIFPLRLPQIIIPFDSEKIILKKNHSSVTLVVGSQSAKQKLSESINLPDANILVIRAAAGHLFQPMQWSEQQSLKMHYTQGREFFLVRGEDKTVSSFMSLLKAFSAFKKWQHSSMKLVVSGKISFTKNEEWNEKTRTYKYRDDVVFLNNLSEEQYATFAGSAYVFIHTPVQDNDVLPLLQALQCGTPCISFTTGSIAEYMSDAVVLIEPDNYDLLSEKMIFLYKDETSRSNLIAKGLDIAKQYTKEESLHQLQSVIFKTIHEKI